MALRTPLSVTPHLYMGDSTGRPLDKGVVYFGEQDKDPEFYPINLFSDDALTKPLAQPVHTKGGYLYDKGDMVEPHAKELIYSVKVLDSYGRKVFYKGAMMRNSWNDDVIEQINTAIIGSADAARQVAIDITNDAINNTAVEGGVLADTFVVVDGSLSQRTINKGLESIADLSSIKNPKDGLRVYVKSYHAGLGKGGGYFTYDSSKSSLNDGGMIFNGWVRDNQDPINITYFGAVGDGVFRKAFPDFTSAEDIVLEYPAFARYLVGTPEQIPYKKTDLLNASQDWFAIQKAVDHLKTLGGGVLELRGTFVLTHPVIIDFSHITVNGGGTSKIINRFGQAFIDAGVPRLYRGVTDAMFSITGRGVAAGNITEKILEHSNQLKIDNPLLYSVGDKVGMIGERFGYTRNLSIITNIDVGTKTITVDRPITNEVAASTVDRVSPLTKVIPVENVHITGFDVDFNGTEAVPRYGFFVLGSYMYASSVTNITGKNIASKVVEFSRSFDCDIDNVKVIRGVDNLDTGGHGYAVRLSMSNDVRVNKVKGTYCRHTVDLTGSSRNTISNCSSYFATGASYLGHMNGCKNNIFTNNIAVCGTVAAYSFKTDAGDTGNIIDGGYVVNEPVIYMEQDNSNIVKNLVIINSDGRYNLETAGETTLDGCTIISSSTAISGSSKGLLRFNNCDFRLSGYRSLGNIISNAGKILEFNNCVFNIDSPSTVLETRVSDVDIILNKCVVTVKNNTSNSPIFGGIDYNLIRSIDCTLEFIPTPTTDSEGVTTYTDGGSMFSLGNANSTLELLDNTIINSRYIFRRYGTSPKLILGANTLINSSYPAMANTVVETRGVVTFDSASPGGTWLEGSVIKHSKPIMGYMGAVKTATAWVRVNQLAMAGGTSNRPDNVADGFMYFDTTLNKPIYKVAAGWVDAAGATA